MKLLVGTIIIGATVSAFGQEAAVAPRAAVEAEIAARAAGSALRTATDVVITGPMKQAPFSADESGETVRIMADGNRIVESWSGKMARNSLGRIRRVITSGKVGDGFARPMVFGSGVLSPGVVAIGSAGGERQIFLSKSDAEHGATRAVLAPAAEGSGGVTVVTTAGSGELRAATLARVEAATAARAEVVALSDKAEALRIALPKPVEDGKIQTRKESLGTRDFSGVQAEGVRVITTFAAGAVGNEKEIEVSSETWFAKDLGVIVYSKRIDPRFGETTYQMTNINRSEPDPSLFPNK
jgi:hypothetical protein